MKYSILSTIFLAASLSPRAASLQARVIDIGHRPIQGAKVTIYEKGLTTYTDAQGMFSFTFDWAGIRPRQVPMAQVPAAGYRYEGYDLLGRALSGFSSEPSGFALLSKPAAYEATLSVTARGYPTYTRYVSDTRPLDSLIMLVGKGIKLTRPLGQGLHVFEDLKIFAEHRSADEHMRVDFRMAGHSRLFRLNGPSCLADTRFVDTCTMTVPVKAVVPRDSGSGTDTVNLVGTTLMVRVSEIGNDSVWAESAPIGILKKPAPVFTVTYSREVSINDTFFLSGTAEDPVHEPLNLFWQLGSARTPAIGGKADFQAPASADTTMVYRFVAVRNDESEYADSTLVKVLWDYPVIAQQADTAIPIHQSAVFRVRATNRFGGNVKYEWDFGAKGAWITGPTDSIVYQGQNTLATAVPIAVRVTDDDGLSSTSKFNVKITYPFFVGGGSYISGTVAMPDKGVLFAGAKDYNIWFGQADSLGRLQWSKTLSRCISGSSGDYKTAKIIRNSQGGATLVGQSFSSGSNGEFRILRVSLTGDSLGEKTVPYTSYAKSKKLLEEANGDLLLVYTEFFRGKVAHLDAAGTIKFISSYPTFRDINDAVLLPNGNLLLAGLGQNDPQGNFYRSALVEATPTGDTIWTKTYSYPNHSFEKVFPIGGGYRIFTEVFDGSSNGFKSFRTDATGNFQDSVNYSTSGRFRLDYAVTSDDGGYLAAGGLNVPLFTDPNVLIFKLRADASLEWQKPLPYMHGGEINASNATGDGGYWLGGIGNLGAPATAVLIPLRADGEVR